MANTITKCSVQIENINLKLLKEQKKALIIEIEFSVGKHKDDLTGILHLIDHIQDQAVEQHGFKDKNVYYFPKNDGIRINNPTATFEIKKEYSLEIIECVNMGGKDEAIKIWGEKAVTKAISGECVFSEDLNS